MTANEVRLSWIAHHAGQEARFDYQEWKLSPEGREAHGDSVAHFGSDAFGVDRVDELCEELGVERRTRLFGRVWDAFGLGFDQADAALNHASRNRSRRKFNPARGGAMTVVARQTGGPKTHCVPEDPRVGFARCLADCGHPAWEITDEQLTAHHRVQKITCPGCATPAQVFYAQPEYVVSRYGLA